jgi:formylglycine-generating enzyme required for sulfatase activity
VILCTALAGWFSPVGPAAAQAPSREVLEVENSQAATEAEMNPYAELIEHTEVTFDMVPIPGGTFVMGSPDSEDDRNDDEGPQRKVKIDPFWMGKHEVTWDEFENWMFDMDIQRRKLKKIEPNARDKAADEYQLTQPTEPYTDMTFGMGGRGHPAICITQLAARIYCMWLTEKTGRFYRLPTEAEWEYACRAGTTTAYHFGDDPYDLDDYGWYYDNSDEKYHKVGQLKPNPWGLFDMHGNVSEWVLDQGTPDGYPASPAAVLDNPLAIPTKLYPRVVRGGSWNDDPEMLRSAVRSYSTPKWKDQDPQLPQSIWYHTDAIWVGFRIVRPLVEPSAEQRAAKWDKQAPLQDRKMGRG